MNNYYNRQELIYKNIRSQFDKLNTLNKRIVINIMNNIMKMNRNK